MAAHFVDEGDFVTKNSITVKKYKSKKSKISVYFCNIESQVINGYFAFGIDQPEACGIETLLWQLDSSGGLLPKPMRGDMLRPAWQFHGAENPLADRDQSCYVCCGLGEIAFLGTFSCCVYLIQNIEAVFEVHGYHSAAARKLCQNDDKNNEGGEPSGAETPDEKNAKDMEDVHELMMEAGGDSEPKLNCREFYCLSEAGEGAMAWEATLQAMFPGSSAFWNRLLFDGKNKLSDRMRDCFDQFYRPENLTVVITGTIEDHNHILETLHEYEVDYAELHPNMPDFIMPWSSEPLPAFQFGVETNVRFIPRNPTRKADATACFGWRGCPSTEIQTAFAIKILTAYASVGPLWNKFIAPGTAQRISWCLLEYVDTCALITVHGIKSCEDSEAIIASLKAVFVSLAEVGNDLMQLKDIQAMAERVGWHNVRELESEPALILASSITKAERYGGGEREQLEKRLEPSGIFDELVKKPLEYWKGLISKYFISHGTFVTKITPRSYDHGDESEQIPAAAASEEGSFQSELPSERSFSDTSKRASSRPRSKASNSVGEGSFSFHEDDLAKGEGPETKLTGQKALDKSSLAEKDCSVDEDGDQRGHIEKILTMDPKPFPFVENTEEADDFDIRLRTTTIFLEQIAKCNLRNYPISEYYSDGDKQHPKFPVDNLPYYTILDDTPCSFVYLTMVMDTSHLNDDERKLVAIITSALGAILCPRPPGLDTDADISNPTEFNPPLLISDSQVSLGLNGEMMQSIFSTLIVRPEHYAWAIGMMNYVLFKHELSVSFLKFVCQEAAKGLAYNYRMQTVDKPNYEYFDSCEINLYALIKQIYKKESNARLFVGRRRLDLINEYLSALNTDPETCMQETVSTWRKLVDEGRVVFQIAANVDELTSQVDPCAAWKQYFGDMEKNVKFSKSCQTLEQELINSPGAPGIAVSVKHARPACLTLAIPIDPTADYFPSLCVTMQLFSMAQKWVWLCIEEEDPGQPALRMPCSFANIITLNLESPDVIGSLQIMKRIINEHWEWLNSLLIATKLMMVNDPSSNEMGPQGAIAMTLLTNLARQPVSIRRDLMMKCLKVTLDDVKAVIRDHLLKLFDPSCCWCALMAEEDEKPKLVNRLRDEHGFNFEEEKLAEMCTTL